MNKHKDEYFENLAGTNFKFQLEAYKQELMKFCNMMETLWLVAKEDESKVSMNLCSKMRQKTVDLEKFGRMFRKNTVAMKKERRNAMDKDYDSLSKEQED